VTAIAHSEANEPSSSDHWDGGKRQVKIAMLSLGASAECCTSKRH
jgi:hypothetical protein